jgi:uncharacterized protein (DUF1330 family)
MPTYIVGDIHISDPATYQAHLPRALATIARFGGRVIAGGGKIDLLGLWLLAGFQADVSLPQSTAPPQTALP